MAFRGPGLWLIPNNGLVGGDQPLSAGPLEDEQDSSIYGDTSVRGLVGSDGVAEIAGMEDGERLDEVYVTTGDDTAPPVVLNRHTPVGQDMSRKVVAVFGVESRNLGSVT